MAVSAYVNMRYTCSSFAGWYYFGPREQGQMPKHPTLSALGRASTLSLGSIAFGSLIVTLLDIMKMILQAARQNANADGHREFHPLVYLTRLDCFFFFFSCFFVYSYRGVLSLLRGMFRWYY